MRTSLIKFDKYFLEQQALGVWVLHYSCMKCSCACACMWHWLRFVTIAECTINRMCSRALFINVLCRCPQLKKKRHTKTHCTKCECVTKCKILIVCNAGTRIPLSLRVKMCNIRLDTLKWATLWFRWKCANTTVFVFACDFYVTKHSQTMLEKMTLLLCQRHQEFYGFYVIIRYGWNTVEAINKMKWKEKKISIFKL